MIVSIKERLTPKEKEFFMGTHNGLAIVETVGELHDDGLKSEIKVINYAGKQSYLINRYEVIILEGAVKIRLANSNLDSLQGHANSMQNETTLADIINDGRHK
jgi:hypothetical protein